MCVCLTEKIGPACCCLKNKRGFCVVVSHITSRTSFHFSPDAFLAQNATLMWEREPNQRRWHAKMEAPSEYVHIAYTFFCTFGADLYASVGAYQQNFCIGAQSEVYQDCAVGRERVNYNKRGKKLILFSLSLSLLLLRMMMRCC